jgi:hypothetical protein
MDSLTDHWKPTELEFPTASELESAVMAEFQMTLKVRFGLKLGLGWDWKPAAASDFGSEETLLLNFEKMLVLEK